MTGTRRPMPPEDRFTGCLLGQCLGDALGFLVEGEPGYLCASYVDHVLQAGRAGEGRRGPYGFGQVSDDSQLARELIESYVARGRLDPDDYARRIRDLFADDRVVGGGRTTAAAARRLAAGVPWTRSGEPPPAAGNGSAMRAAPIGLMFFDDPPSLIRAAHLQGWITHQDPRCSAGAVAVAGAVALALDPAPFDRAAVVHTLAEWTRTVERSMAELIERLADWSALSPDAAAPRIAAAGREDTDGRPPTDGISPFVVPSVLWSLYAFLRSPDNYWEAIGLAIRVGGDVDTTAAMAGAMAGARAGLTAIPPGLAARLNDRGAWGGDDLVDLARRLWHLKMKKKDERP